MKNRVGFPGILLALCLCTAFLSGCGEDSLHRNREIRIGVTVYDEYDTFISELMEDFSV